MLRSLSVLIVAVLFCPSLHARDIHKWENVRKLKRGTPVLILLLSGASISGKIESVADSGIRLKVPDRRNPHAAWIQRIGRASIRRIIRGPGPLYLPNQRDWMIAGAVAGGATGVASGAIDDARDGNHYDWLIKGAAGTGLGAMTGFMAAGVIAVAQVPRILLHHSKVIFESQAPVAAAGSSKLQRRKSPQTARTAVDRPAIRKQVR